MPLPSEVCSTNKYTELEKQSYSGRSKGYREARVTVISIISRLLDKAQRGGADKASLCLGSTTLSPRWDIPE